MFQKQPPEVFYRKIELKNVAKFTKNPHLSRSLSFKIIAGPMPVDVSSCFSMIFKKIL